MNLVRVVRLDGNVLWQWQSGDGVVDFRVQGGKLWIIQTRPGTPFIIGSWRIESLTEEEVRRERSWWRRMLRRIAR